MVRIGLRRPLLGWLGLAVLLRLSVPLLRLSIRLLPLLRLPVRLLHVSRSVSGVRPLGTHRVRRARAAHHDDVLVLLHGSSRLLPVRAELREALDAGIAARRAGCTKRTGAVGAASRRSAMKTI